MHNNMNIPVGISDFEKIRKNGYYYIDKTKLIAELLKKEPTEVTLITRPRRFGKTMGMSMLANFFDIRKDSRECFDGLVIQQHEAICKKWMNRYPTLFLSFKDVDGINYENALGMLKFVISQICEEHSYLEECDRVSNEYKEMFARLKKQEGTLTDVKCGLLIIMKMMQIYYNKPVILLLDEYDVPVAKASAGGYYNEMMEVIKAIMSTTLKDNSSLCFAVITGCLKIAKESIFTGTNNFVSDTIASSNLNEYFGFTQEDVDKILDDAQVAEKADIIKKWYDGYHFGDVDVYCPWDVMNYIFELQKDSSAKPVGYWRNTSDNAIIRTFIDYSGTEITWKMEKLMSGGYIIQHIEDNLTYDYLNSSEDNLWSILYLTGYLTKEKKCNVEEAIPDGMCALIIPNMEIKEIFEATILSWFNDTTKKIDRSRLFNAVWNGDSITVTKEMNILLRQTISYHDYREDFYHAFLAGIFAGAGYMVESNREHGEGRSDVIVYDMAGARVAIFEAKYSKDVAHLNESCVKAIEQINTKMYSEEFNDSYDEVLCYGISFFKKRCMVLKK